MTRTGRELTLFGIYGSPDAPRDRGVKAARARRLRPSRVVATPPREPRRPEAAHRPCISHDERADGAGGTEVNMPPCLSTNNVSAREVEDDAFDHESMCRADKQPELQTSIQSKPSRSPRPRVDVEKRASFVPPETVMSLYGDGYVIITPHKDSQRDWKVPFSLRIRMFKASDESADLTKLESGGSRHLHPELNNRGEFVRWSCCGSTNNSIYGCPVASFERAEQHLPVGDLLRLRRPRLLACKLSEQTGNEDNTIRFVIFDRGYPKGHDPGTIGAINAGCRVWWQGYECWATNYNIPHGCWTDFKVLFDGRYLRVLVDDVLVDSAAASHRSRVPQPLCRSECALGCFCPNSHWVTHSVLPTSMYICGYSKYSSSVNDWRTRCGFVGLVAEIEVSSFPRSGNASEGLIQDSHCVHIISVGIGEVKDISTTGAFDIAICRNVYWRSIYPPFEERSDFSNIRLLGNFHHGAHNDLLSQSQKSFENTLLSAVQSGEVRVRMEISKDFESIFGADHGCRSQQEYDQKCDNFVHRVERLSPLLAVDVNRGGSENSPGLFEVYLELTRSHGCKPVSIPLHSMDATSTFPSFNEITAKICAIVAHEARRSPGETVVQQAFRHFLSLASQGKDNRERAFMESVINRRTVITEKRLATVFQRIGFHFASEELQDLAQLFRKKQADYLRNQHRMDDLPTMSLLSPTPSGLYRLPLTHHVSLSSITPSERAAHRSPWRFMALLLNYDLHLIDFIQDGCPTSSYGNASYSHSRYLHGGFVDRLSLHLSEVATHVYCVLFVLKRYTTDNQAPFDKSTKEIQFAEHQRVHETIGRLKRVAVQLENTETLQPLAHFEVQPATECKWLSLAALYRSKKSILWRFQVLGGSNQATSIHAGLEEMNLILVDRHIVQVYEVVVSYESNPEKAELGDFVRRFSKNIRFGRNGKFVINPRVVAGGDDKNEKKCTGNDDTARQSQLQITLRIQGVTAEIVVYRHEDNSRSLPTVQSVYRSILRILAENGVKESLQQNPFVAGDKRLKRAVTVRVTMDDTNAPVANAYVFIEESLDNQKAMTSLASKIVPTLTMGSRLVSIRKRLQKKKYSEQVKLAALRFVDEIVETGLRYAMVSLRDSKLVPIVKSRALLRRAMRRRYDMIKQKILDAMSESERSRVYSQSGPTRLQQLFRPQLNLSNSEKELVNELVEMELEAFRRDLGLANRDQVPEDHHAHVEEVWQTHLKENHSSAQSEIKGDRSTVSSSAEGPSQTLKKPNRALLTNVEGIATCSLAPGSYSMHVFHNDFFEWTSLVVVFPTVNASGLYGSSISTSAPQEIVVPVEAFKWSYTIQLVDFYNQHTPKLIESVPVLITDKCTSEQTTLQTRSDGSVSWDVRKGMYSVRVPTEQTSILYSGLKNVIVDGGRYHPPRTIFIPIMLGKVSFDLHLHDAIMSANTIRSTAIVQLSGENHGAGSGSAVTTKRRSSIIEELGLVVQSIPVNSSSKVQTRPGKYILRVCSDGYFPYSRQVEIAWNSGSDASSSCLLFLCPVFNAVGMYRVVLGYSAIIKDTLDAIVDVEEPEGVVRSFWKHGVDTNSGDVTYHGLRTQVGCRFEAFTLVCWPGHSYNLRVAVGAALRHNLQLLKPRVQVYDLTGLVMDAALLVEQDLSEEFYWNPCSWDKMGKFVSHQVESSDPATEPTA